MKINGKELTTNEYINYLIAEKNKYKDGSFASHCEIKRINRILIPLQINKEIEKLKSVAYRTANPTKYDKLINKIKKLEKKLNQ